MIGDHYRPVPAPAVEQLEILHDLYLHAGSTRVPHTHADVRQAASRITTGIRALMNAGDPDTYRGSADRVSAARSLADRARDFSRLAFNLLGDKSRILHEAREGQALLEEFAVGCAEADVQLRAAVHDSLRKAA